MKTARNSLGMLLRWWQIKSWFLCNCFQNYIEIRREGFQIYKFGVRSYWAKDNKKPKVFLDTRECTKDFVSMGVYLFSQEKYSAPQRMYTPVRTYVQRHLPVQDSITIVWTATVYCCRNTFTALRRLKTMSSYLKNKKLKKLIRFLLYQGTLLM